MSAGPVVLLPFFITDREDAGDVCTANVITIDRSVKEMDGCNSDVCQFCACG